MLLRGSSSIGTWVFTTFPTFVIILNWTLKTHFHLTPLMLVRNPNFDIFCFYLYQHHFQHPLEMIPSWRRKVSMQYFAAVFDVVFNTRFCVVSTFCARFIYLFFIVMTRDLSPLEGWILIMPEKNFLSRSKFRALHNLTRSFQKWFVSLWLLFEEENEDASQTRLWHNVNK